MNAVIKVENLGKKYIIGHQRQRGGATMRDTMTHTARGVWQRVRHPLSPNRESIDLEELWALKDVNFEVQQGERIGMIGPNGAGKSTLLKILSRITEPTTGKVRIKGRVSSLLEVGTGFHPELTGRENIFLNGAILGMNRQEIRQKFDEIVAFSELEKFLDTPVKRYSSGMYVRLAFAVGAHLEPEILIVDEVLAVGDASFQKKCLGKMKNVAKEGRTVLFVSHNMGAISAFCERALLLQQGHMDCLGPVDSVVKAYLCDSVAGSAYVLNHHRRAHGLEPHISHIRVLGGDGDTEGSILCGGRCQIILETTAPLCRNPRVNITIYDQLNTPVAQLNTGIADHVPDPAMAENQLCCAIEQLNLMPGQYYINVSYRDGDVLLDHITQARGLQIVESDFLGRGKLPSNAYAKVVLKHKWYSNREC